MDEKDVTKEAPCLPMGEVDYTAIFNAANDAIFINDIETKEIVDVNEKACEMFCYPREELLKAKVGDLSIGEGLYTHEEGVKLLDKAAAGEPQLFEWLAKDKANRAFWVEINAARAVINGKYRLLAVVRDINDRKQTEERLNKINDVFLNFGPDSAENINRLTAMCGELLWADCALYSRIEGEFLYSCGRWNAPEDFNPIDKPDGHICYDLINKGTGEVTVIRDLPKTEYYKTDPNVARYGLETYVGCPVKFSGRHVGTLCAVYKYDFAPGEEDKKILSIIASAIGVEEERREAESVSRLAKFSIERAADGIFWIGRDARILYVNDKTCDMLGYSRDELLSIKVHDIDPSYTEKIWPSHWAELKARGSFTLETKHRRKDGTFFPVEVSVNYLKVENEEYNFAFARDISERKKAESDLLRRDYQLEILSRTSQHINAVLEVPVIMRTLVAAAIELVDGSAGASGLLRDGRIVFNEYNDGARSHEINYAFEIDHSNAPGSTVLSLKPYISNDVEHDEAVLSAKKKAFGIYNLICIPIISGKGELIGCFEIYNKKEKRKFDSQDVFMLQGLAASGAVALKNAKVVEELRISEKKQDEANKKLKKMALKDPQTGLYNHHYLSEVIESEFYRARRHGHPLSVIMMDIDYFKSINDAYGHEFGDLVLSQFAVQLKKIVRRYDIIVRFGGEEFVVLSPSVDKNKALAMAKRLQDAIHLYNFGDEKRVIKLKLSLAVYSYPDGRLHRGVDLLAATEKILDNVKSKGGDGIYSVLDAKEQKEVLPHEFEEPTDVKFLKEKIEKLTRRGRQNLIESIAAFAKTIELKDHYTGKHVENTVYYSVEIAKELDLTEEELENIKQASMLHDLGKVGISDKILLKKSKLTKKEFEEIKKHPQIAADIIRPIQFMHDIIPLILYHHERWDGKGYPAGLKGDEIPMGSRIIAVADVYQALTSNRPYRKAFPRDVAAGMIKKGSGTQFDPRIVDVFLRILKKNKK